MSNTKFDKNANHLMTYEEAVEHRKEIFANDDSRAVYNAFRKYTGNYQLDESRNQIAVRPYMQKHMTQEMREAGIDEYMVFGSFSFSPDSFSVENIYETWQERAFTWHGNRTVAGIYVQGFMEQFKYHFDDTSFVKELYGNSIPEIKLGLGKLMQSWLAYMTKGIDAEKIVLDKLNNSSKLRKQGWWFRRAKDHHEYDDIDIVGKRNGKEYYFSVKISGGAFSMSSISEYRFKQGKNKPHFYINEKMEYRLFSDLEAVQQFSSFERGIRL